MFNGCKIPGEAMDTLNDYFKTGVYLNLMLHTLLPLLGAINELTKKKIDVATSG